jgi:hypothetical protein
VQGEREREVAEAPPGAREHASRTTGWTRRSLQGLLFLWEFVQDAGQGEILYEVISAPCVRDDPGTAQEGESRSCSMNTVVSEAASSLLLIPLHCLRSRLQFPPNVPVSYILGEKCSSALHVLLLCPKK